MKALIIDDEPMPARYLQKLIEKHCYEITSIEIQNSSVEAVEQINQQFYDIIFLDVEMPELNGFDLLERIDLPEESHVIFTTAYSEYAINAFKVEALDYLLKMVEKEDLIAAVRKVVCRKREKSEEKNDVISIFFNQEYHIVQLNDIIRLEADGAYTKVILKDMKLFSSRGLNYFEEKLNHSRFFRCHKSHIVNIKEIAKIGKGRSTYITLKNDKTIPISVLKKVALEEVIGIR